VDATAESGLLGRLVNHSRLKFNCCTRVVELDDRPRLILVASRDISIGDELLYDYGDRSKESLEAYPWLASWNCGECAQIDSAGVALILVASRDVSIGEELLYDYGDRSKESLEAYPWLALWTRRAYTEIDSAGGGTDAVSICVGSWYLNADTLIVTYVPLSSPLVGLVSFVA